MNRLLPIALFVTLSGSASAQCIIYPTNPPITGPCDDAPVFPAAGIKDPSTPSVPPVPPVSGGAPLPLKDYSPWTSSLIQIPCCVNFQTKAGTITMDLDNGTVDLHGTKLDDAARAFWDAVAQTAGHPAVKQRAYTLGEIDRMRATLNRMNPWTRLHCSGDGSPCIDPDKADRDARIEDQLRTYMAAGITPEELEARAK